MVTSTAPPPAVMASASAPGSSGDGASTAWSSPSARARSSFVSVRAGPSDRAAERLRELDDRGTHARSHRMHEHVLALAHPAAGPERVMGRDEHLGDAARLDEVDGFGHSSAVGLVHHECLGLCAAAHDPEDPVADCAACGRPGRARPPCRRTPCRGCPRARPGVPDSARLAASGRHGSDRRRRPPRAPHPAPAPGWDVPRPRSRRRRETPPLAWRRRYLHTWSLRSPRFVPLRRALR